MTASPSGRSALIAFVIAMMFVPALAQARRRATGSGRSAIVAAAVAAHDIGSVQAPCVVIFISTVNRTWAMLAFPRHPSSACSPYQANGVSLFHKRSGRWRFVTAGSDFRCPIPKVPLRVGRDLKACH